MFGRTPFALVGALIAFDVASAIAFDAQAFSPAVDPQGYFSIYTSRAAPAGRYHVGLWYSFANEPVAGAVDTLSTIDLTASFSLLDSLEVGVDVPVSLVDSDLSGVSDAPKGDDVRAVVRWQVTDERSAQFGVALVPFVDVDSGSDSQPTVNGTVDYGFLAAVDRRFGRLRSSVNLGYKVNGDAFDGGGESDEILFGLGLGYVVVDRRRFFAGAFDSLEVLGEVFGATAEQRVFDSEAATPLEVLAGLRVYSPSGIYLSVGLGHALTDGVNGAAPRVVTQIGYTPPPPPQAPPAPLVAVPEPRLPPLPFPPPQPLPRVVETDEQIVLLEPIYFDFDSDRIKTVSYEVLTEVAEIMKRRPTALVRVEGHTDSRGAETYNAKLSQRRALAVIRHLTEAGILAGRLDAAGIGEGRPITTNDTEEGRARNRRTEFHIVREVR